MRAIFFVLSLTVTLASYAQSVSIADFRAISFLEKDDSLSGYLTPRGYFKTSHQPDLSLKSSRPARAWKFTGGKKDDKAISTILKYMDTSLYQVGFRTVSPHVYTQIVNSLIASGFNRVEAFTSDQDVEIQFSNGNEIVAVTTDHRKNEPEFVLQYKKPGGKLVAYQSEKIKQNRIYHEHAWARTDHNDYPARKTVTRNKTAAMVPRKSKQAPVKRYYHRERYQ